MSKASKKKQQMVEDVPVDKIDHFLASNYKKLLGGFAVILVIFIAGYAFMTLGKSKDSMLTSKEGQYEMLLTIAGTSDENLKNYLAVADEFPKAGDYINLKAAEVLVAEGKVKEAEKPMTTAGGAFKEFADGLKFDTGTGTVDASAYMKTGKMGALWYYRAYLAADEAKKAEVLESFRKDYPDNQLLKQLERWNG